MRVPKQALLEWDLLNAELRLVEYELQCLERLRDRIRMAPWN